VQFPPGIWSLQPVAIVECAATSLLLLGAIRDRYPSVQYLLDGDGGDENLKAYPLEDSDLTISSVLKNPLLYGTLRSSSAAPRATRSGFNACAR
jgi:hypothetical protein